MAATASSSGAGVRDRPSTAVDAYAGGGGRAADRRASRLVVAVFLLPDDELPALPAFALAHALVASFVSAVTALLMVNHARSTGRRGYLMIGGTFLYMCLVLLVFPMYFVGAVIPGERVWGGPQSAANLFYAWHFAFPIGVAASAI
ncbi:MAG: hypothetical protein IPN52_12070 [Micrococcales bacterium]|nr:hypothetical protein [Micrococcales bacterium]